MPRRVLLDPGMAKAALSALVLGALCAHGIASCTPDQTPVIVPMGYNQQVCLSISSPIDGNCLAVPNPATQTIPVTLELNSTFELRPPGACYNNGLNNCGHAIFYVNGQCATQSSSLITDLSLGDMAVPYGKTTITALLVDDCNDPWTLVWNDAGVVEDGGLQCLPDASPGSSSATFGCPAGLPAAPSSKITNTCPSSALDAGVNSGPYFASVTVDIEPSCPGSGAGGAGGGSTSTATSTATSTSSSGMGGASTSTSSSGMGGASTSTSTATSTSSSGMGGASASSTSTSTSSSGTGGASASSTGSGMGGASSSASGTGGAGPADAGDGG